MKPSAKSFALWSMLKDSTNFRPFSEWQYYQSTFAIDAVAVHKFIKDNSLSNPNNDFSTASDAAYYYNDNYIGNIDIDSYKNYAPMVEVRKFANALKDICAYILSSEIDETKSTIKNETESGFTDSESSSSKHEVLTGTIVLKNGQSIPFGSNTSINLEKTQSQWSIFEAMNSFKDEMTKKSFK